MTAPQPIRRAGAETLKLIQEAPGIYLAQIAEQRHVDPAAVHRCVLGLERRGLVRTELAPVPGTRYPARRCYPVRP